MDGDRLILLFGVLMVVVGVLMLKPKKPVPVECRPVDLRMCLATAAMALAADAASGFFGIGGGFLIVPGLMLVTALNYTSSGLVDWWLAAEFVGAVSWAECSACCSPLV